MKLEIRKTRGVYSTLLLRILIVLLISVLGRFFFYLFNLNYFSELNAAEVIRLLVVGLRFDISAILVITTPYIFLCALPIKLVYNRIYQLTTNILFYLIPNIAALLFNFIDLVYFRFSLKRSTADLFRYMNNEGGELFSLVPEYFRDFWPETLVMFMLIFLLIFLNRLLNIRKPDKLLWGVRQYLYKTFVLLIIAGIVVIGIRGGFQLKPINIITAGKYSDLKLTPLILNSPFTIIKTYNKHSIEQVSYFPDEEMELIYDPVHLKKTITRDSVTDYLNIVIIVMESFTAEYIKTLNPRLQANSQEKGYTPFLDSLIQHSVYFKAYANGKRSIEAIPAIVSGLPALMNSDFLSSPYANNRINSLPQLLKQKGYTSQFFHGGNNGTMSFDTYAKISGFDDYYGRNEFGDDTWFDGKWGIYDEAFFQYFANTLNNTVQPFFSIFFSLSSHHPYSIPESQRDKFNKGTLDIHESIMYADYSLGAFFKTAKKMPWYKNTLFVITADHTAETYYPENQTMVARYEIPLVFYLPGDSLHGFKDITAQQTDIMPTILNLISYNGSFVAFGSDLFESNATHYAINYLAGTYQLIQDNYVLVFNGKRSIALYNMLKDRDMSNNIIESEIEVKNEMELLIKAIIQQYNERMANNRLFAE